MRGTKLYGMVAAAFMAGAFIASPELRAYASTIANDVICSGCVGTSDLAGNAVTAAKIKADSVGGSELIGVTKLLFGQCTADSTEGTTDVASGGTLVVECTISGVDGDDSAIATLNDNLACFDIKSAKPLDGKVSAFIHNECSFTTIFGTGSRIGIIVFDK